MKVSLESIRKSGRVLYAFTQFYLPFYDCNLQFIFFDRYDIFGGLSAAIYEIDERIEAGLDIHEAFRDLEWLFNYLDERIDCNQYIRERFEDARRYYSFESDLLRGVATFSFAELVSLTEIRSFDFRLMHQALTKLSGNQNNDSVFSWFRSFEMLMEIEDDLLSAQEDMARGTYNILCLAARLSPKDASVQVENFRSVIERNINNLSKSLPEPQRVICDSVFSTYRNIVPQPSIALLQEV